MPSKNSTLIDKKLRNNACYTKHYFQLFFVIIFCHVLLFAHPANGQKVGVFIPDTTFFGGDTIIVPIKIAQEAPVDSFSGALIDIRYNQHLIEFIGIEAAGTLLDKFSLGINITYKIEEQIQQSRIGAYSAFNIIFGSDDTLIRLKFRNKSYQSGSVAEIELFSTALERTDWIDSTSVPYYVPVELSGGRIITVESKSVVMGSADPLAGFDFGDSSRVHAVFSSGDYAGKSVTVTHMGRTDIFDPESTPRNISVYRIESDIQEGGFSSVLRFFYTPAQLVLANISDETKIALARYNTAEGKWLIVPSNSNIDDNYIFARTETFSYWKVFNDTSQSVVSVYEPTEPVPAGYALTQNYPNPFNPVTAFTILLPKESFVELKIFNITGQLIRTLSGGNLGAGSHVFNWDGRNERGLICPSGIYLYHLAADGYSDTKKMILVK